MTQATLLAFFDSEASLSALAILPAVRAIT